MNGFEDRRSAGAEMQADADALRIAADAVQLCAEARGRESQAREALSHLDAAQRAAAHTALRAAKDEQTEIIATASYIDTQLYLLCEQTQT
jgi:hypothetical protein